MNERKGAVSTKTLGALAVYCQLNPGSGPIQAIIDEAVNDWLLRQKGRKVAESGHGLRWKSILLPVGTDVRIDYRGQAFLAKVEGDDLVFDGRVVSPRQMLLQVTGLSGNAWLWLHVRRPGDRHFVQAAALRRRVALQGARV
jgi:hypothetical protein